MGVPATYGLTTVSIAMALARFPGSNVPVVADVATLVLCIFSGLKTLQAIHASVGRVVKVTVAIDYAAAMYLFCLFIGLLAMFAYRGCGGCS